MAKKTKTNIISSAKTNLANRKQTNKELFGDVLEKTEPLKSPEFIPPMQATRIDEAFNDDAFLYEVKWDGYRIIASIISGKVHLYSRSGLDYTNNYSPITEHLSAVTVDVVLDGEIVVLNEEGKPSFDKLQKYREGDNLMFYVFDILWLEGRSLLKLTLTERRMLLEKTIRNSDLIRLSDTFTDGIELFESIKQLGLEGIVAKRKDSSYKPGERVKTWYKIPAELRQEFVIGGWTESESARSFRSLLFGYFQNGKFIYAGHAGGGYKENEMPEILSRLKKIEIKKQPFDGEVETDHDTHWVKPQLVAEFKYATFTASGKIRKPAIFLGFRKDKKAKEVVREIEIPEQEIAQESSKPIQREQKKIKTSEDSNWPELEKINITSRTVHEFEGKEVQLTNIERRLWGEITKAHLLMYYYSVYKFMIPHLKDRPLSLHIKPYGPTAPGLYIKDMEGRGAEWTEIFTVVRKHKKKGKRDKIDYLVCNDEATLQYIINLGCIDVNPWTSRTSSSEIPDYIIIDLDPSDNDFDKAIDAAKAAKEVFDKHKIIGFPKTSGKTGIHLYLPCKGFTFPQARSIAENICSSIHHIVPDITTTDISINSRGDKLYLDPNQNDFADTVAAPYSVRPFEKPTVSTPLEWKEINSKLDPAKFTIHTIPDRLKKKGDLFKGVLSESSKQKNLKGLKYFLDN